MAQEDVTQNVSPILEEENSGQSGQLDIKCLTISCI